MGGVGRYGDWRRYAWAYATADKNMANWDGVAGTVPSGLFPDGGTDGRKSGRTAKR